MTISVCDAFYCKVVFGSIIRKISYPNHSCLKGLPIKKNTLPIKKVQYPEIKVLYIKTDDLSKSNAFLQKWVFTQFFKNT